MEDAFQASGPQGGLLRSTCETEGAWALRPPGEPDACVCAHARTHTHTHTHTHWQQSRKVTHFLLNKQHVLPDLCIPPHALRT